MVATRAVNKRLTDDELRDWRIYFELAQRLITKARALYVDEDFGVELANTVYALDATTIDPCLSTFPWAPFRSTKAAVKLHNPAYLRRIRYRDPETGKNLVFLSNQFALPALTICALYRCRWQVELSWSSGPRERTRR